MPLDRSDKYIRALLSLISLVLRKIFALTGPLIRYRSFCPFAIRTYGCPPHILNQSRPADHLPARGFSERANDKLPL
jgi:hypothetical protein